MGVCVNEMMVFSRKDCLQQVNIEHENDRFGRNQSHSCTNTQNQAITHSGSSASSAFRTCISLRKRNPSSHPMDRLTYRECRHVSRSGSGKRAWRSLIVERKFRFLHPGRWGWWGWRSAGSVDRESGHWCSLLYSGVFLIISMVRINLICAFGYS